MSGGRQRPRSEDLEGHDLERVRIRMAHLLEAETGYRSGSRAVHAECQHRSALSMKTKERMICQYVREKFGPGVKVPHYATLAKVWKEWFGPRAPGSATSAPRQRWKRGRR